MTITGRTRVTGLFGYPVEHTLSPAMHNAAFDHLGLDYRYLPFSVHPDDLDHAVASVRALGLAGVNVTVPHKESVLSLLDSVDEEAGFIGAVNTIVNTAGILTGYNTDGRGFMRSLEEAGISAKGKRVLVVGAGGASRAVCYYLSQEAGELDLYDLDRDKAGKLTSDLSAVRSNVTHMRDLKGVSGFDIVINATPLGLKQTDPRPIDVSVLDARQTVCDLIYRSTPLLQDASSRGCRTLDGLGMLLWQGILAFELWTGVLPPVDVMRTALLKAMA